MKRFYLLTLSFLLLFSASFAQKASESRQKSPTGGDGNAITIELEAQAKNVEDVLKEKFKKLKGKREKGFDAFMGQIFPDISPDMLDIYYEVDKKGNDKCIVIMFLSKGYDNWLTSSESSSEINNAKKFLENLSVEVRKYELEIAIDAQTKVVEKALKEQEKLEKEKESLVSENEKLLKELEENKEDQATNVSNQETSKKLIETEKGLLEELKKNLGQVK